MGKEIATRDELSMLIGELSFKGMQAGVESIYRMYSLAAYKENMDAVTFFSGYVDHEGNGATSPKGMMIQINKRIKDKFGRPVDGLSGFELNVLAMIRNKIANTIMDGMKREEDRKEIKARCYRAIDAIYDAAIVG